MRFRGLAGKIAAGYLVIALFITLVLGTASFFLIRSHLVAQAKENLRQNALAIARILAAQPLNKASVTSVLPERPLFRLANRLLGGHYVVLDRQGIIIASNLGERFKPGMRLNELLPLHTWQAELARGEPVSWQNREFVAAAVPIKGGGGNTGTLIMLARMSNLQSIGRELALIIVRSLVLSTLLALVLAFFLARHIARPLSLLQQRTRQLARREFGVAPVELSTGDEIEELGKDFNIMAARLAEYDAAQRRFLQNASHELKTPLMNIQGYAEGILDGVFQGGEVNGGLQVIVKESRRLKNIVDEIIYLSRLESPAEKYSPMPVDLVALMREVQETLRPLAGEKQVRLNAPGELWLSADREKLLRLGMNIVSNALRYARRQVAVEIYAGSAGTAVLTCRDDGPGFPPAQMAHLFERFQKGPGGHTGLGLAIVRAIAEMHGGEVKAANGSHGGAEITVVLPPGEKPA
ncbi:sensor histidine kinase [Desulfotomaculum copahuensis]|uniref:histidine kinase n=1 Tax=Desulfotomaculum copahuensis TaxID=1838280 RepID=A0A1B7LHQ2_9FIRM|nr:ATP-binding protein [Desulfotomaculum copahuensis]OAT85831.1 hypothetical protein A6M21_04955 [Desulfotomaculum copahuensis]